MRVLRPGILGVLLVAPCAFSAFGGYIVANVSLSQLPYAPYTMTSAGSAIYLDDFNSQTSVNLSGIHAIRGDNNSTAAAESVSGSNGQWLGTLGGIAGAAGVCYRASVDASGGGASQGVGSSAVCYAAPPPPPPPPAPIPTTGDGGTGGTGGDTSFDTTGAGSDPLLIALHGAYALSGSDDPVSFDINSTGHALQIGWTARDADVAFLALDRNANGTIDDGAELFGNATPLRTGGRASNGFTALAQYDLNGDGVIDASDPIWNDLLLWIDANHNGRCDPGELQHITASSITGIDIDHHWTGRRDQYGNHFGFEGHLHEGKAVRSFYDVFFVTAR